MRKTKLLAFKQLSAPVRAVVLFLFSAGLVGGLGCATAMVASSGNSNAYAYYHTPILTDTIFALARPDDALAKKIGNDDSIAFIGKKNTYLLIEGGNQLMNIAKELNGDRLTLDKSTQLFLKDKIAWGSLSLSYASKENISQDEADIAKLQTLGFKADRSGVYRLKVKVKGAVYPAVSVSNDQLQQFKQSRALSFYNPPDSSPPPDLGKLVELPIAIAIDVATAPIQLFGLLGAVLVISATGHH